MASKQYIPSDEQIAAWHAGGYIVVRTSYRAANGICRANNVVYPTSEAALAAAVRLDRPDSMTFVNYALPA